MSTFLELEDFDTLIKHCSVEPVIINDVLTRTVEERERLQKKLISNYDSDCISNVPSCGCKTTQGKDKIGIKCPVCGDKVTVPMEQPIESVVWIRAPKKITAMINPHVFKMLGNLFTISQFNLIMWLCDTTYRPPVKVPPVVAELEAKEIPRGYNNFVKHFDDILQVLFNLKIITGNKQKREKRDELLTFCNHFRDSFFSQYLPLPNRIMMVIEDAEVGGRYIDPTLKGAMEAIKTIESIDASLIEPTLRVIENRVAKTIYCLANFTYEYYRDSFAQKTGMFRKHIYGTRTHFSFRAVISSLTGVHRYDEIHIPWSIAVTTFSLHIANKLHNKYNFTPIQIFEFLNEYTLNYSPLMDSIFEELIAEAPDGKGIAVIVQRNPSLLRGSLQLCYITKVKRDIKDPTVSISINIVRSLNADNRVISIS